MREPPDDVHDSLDEKKGTPKGTFFVLLRARLDQPRQEPGRNFGFRFVPSAVAPQRHWNTVIPPTSAFVSLVLASFIGVRVTNVPLIPVAAAKPRTLISTKPSTVVSMVSTYFEAP